MNIGLIFGMVVAIFTMTLLMVFGFQQATNVSEIQGKAEIQRTIKNLRSSVDRVYNLGGESSEKFELTFPSSVIGVCFMPMYRGMSGTQKDGKVKFDVRAALKSNGISTNEAYRMADDVTALRMQPAHGGGFIDNNQTLLLFYLGTSVPEWFYIERLEPTKDSVMDEPLCVGPLADVWLQRAFDDDGAWVGVEDI